MELVIWPAPPQLMYRLLLVQQLRQHSGPLLWPAASFWSGVQREYRACYRRSFISSERCFVSSDNLRRWFFPTSMNPAALFVLAIYLTRLGYGEAEWIVHRRNFKTDIVSLAVLMEFVYQLSFLSFFLSCFFFLFRFVSIWLKLIFYYLIICLQIGRIQIDNLILIVLRIRYFQKWNIFILRKKNKIYNLNIFEHI